MATEFEQGIYHGRILFPVEYPMKPPSIILLTVNCIFLFRRRTIRLLFRPCRKAVVLKYMKKFAYRYPAIM